MCFKTRWGWKLSPDRSGYAAWSDGFCCGAAAFERIAGSPFLNSFAVIDKGL